ncbi:MAG TPA: aminopeptidase P N-terminal domain-containing protein, partial [Acholeplasmataceae bacterium]|nr:aminopeptidase P N-terminal domain-containing protein [Acholeplasmataceae bacterium]
MLEKRRQTYLSRVADQSLSLFFSGFAPIRTADEFYPFSVNRNFYYLTGIEQENVCLVLAKGADKQESFLFIEPIDPIKALWDGAGLSFEEASKIAGIPVDHIKDIKTLQTFIAQTLSTTRRAQFGAIDQIYLDLERLNENVPPTYPITFGHDLIKLYPYVSLRSSQMILAEMRTIKDETEIAEMKK